ncbi:hypothetical protein PQ459_10200 [Chryseobacterium sp. KACC 21268]|nr:hypothetical protein PQ459_10200 [Chryseobacterium sp. KACC 21268]
MKNFITECVLLKSTDKQTIILGVFIWIDLIALIILLILTYNEIYIF